MKKINFFVCLFLLIGIQAQSQSLGVSTTIIQNVTCHGGNNGVVTASPSGGTSPYTYSWATTGGTSQTASGLLSGTYTVTVRDHLGTSASASATVTQPGSLSISVSASHTSICIGVTDTLIASGAVTYSWSIGSTGDTLVFSLDTTTTYTVTGYNTSGCSASANATITANYCTRTVPVPNYILQDSIPSWTSLMVLPGAKFNTIYSRISADFHFRDSIAALHSGSDSLEDPRDTTEAYPLSEESFNRWSSFWLPRVGGGDSLGGLFSVRGDAMYNTFVANLSSPPTCSNGNWYYAGAPSSLQSTTAPVAGIVNFLYFDPNDVTHNTLYAGTTNSGLWRTIDAQTLSPTGPTWTCITDNFFPAGTGVNCVAIAPDGTIYIATGSTRDLPTYDAYGYGVLKSTDGGSTWTVTGLHYTPGVSNIHVVSKLLIDNRTSPYTIWAATQDTLFYSTNHGGNFTGGMPYHVASEQSGGTSNLLDIVLSPYFSSNISSVLVSGTGWSNYASVYKNGPGGSPPCANNCAPGSQGIDTRLYYSCAGSQIAEVHGSGTNNYTPITIPSLFDCGGSVGFPPSAISLASNPPSTNIIWVAFSFGPIYNPTYLYNLSYNGTNWIWSNPSTNMNGGFYGELYMSPANPDILYANGLEAQRLISGTWSVINDYNINETHADVRCVAFDVASSNGASDKIWVGTDGGVSMNNSWTSPTTSWVNKNGTGLNINQYYGLAEQDAYNLLLAGAQDNGEFSYSPSAGWASDVNIPYTASGGDVGQSLLDPNSVGSTNVNAWKFYIGPTDVAKSTSSGAPSTWSNIASFPKANYNSPFAIDATTNPSTAYFGVDQVYNVTTSSVAKGPSSISSSHGGIGGMSTVPSLKGHSYNDMYVGYSAPTWGPPPSGYLWFTSSLSSATPTWTDLTSNISVTNLYSSPTSTTNPFSGWALTDIIVKPDDPNTLWLSFGDFGGPKVITSTNGGTSWSDMSNGLPDFPVNSIVYRSGTNNELYAATDAGVYKWVPNSLLTEDGSWECYNDGLPPVMATGIKINYCTNNLIISTYGRSVWETSLPPETINTPITTNTTWSDPIDLETGIDIQPGVTLTVNSNVNIPENASIIVERGAQLIVNSGGVLTNGCGGFWAGIELQGNANADQTATNQGTVTLNSGSIIEHAVNGITTIKTTPSGWDWSYTGGIITANGANFLDNQRDVQFLYYINPTAGKSMFNKCTFKNCTFYVDGVYYSNYLSIYALQPRVTMYQVHGVYFQGNSFKNEIPTSGSNSISNMYARSSGIYSIDASYRLDNCNCVGSGNCCGTGNTFSGFEFGILAANSNPAYNIQINGNTFTDNYADVDIQNINAMTITHNTFTKTAYEGTNSCIPRCATPYNIYLDQCSQYNVSSNSLSVSGYYSATDPTWGVVVNNSGTPNNLVNNNTFTDIYVQSQSQGINGNVLSYPIPGLSTGLQFWCNQYNQNGSINENGGADIAENIGYGNTTGLMDEIQGWGCASGGSTTANNAFNYTCSSVSRANLYTYPTFPYKLEYTWAGASTSDDPSCTSGPGITVGSCAGLTANCSPTYTINIQSGNLLAGSGVNYHTGLRSQKQSFKHSEDSLTGVLDRGNTSGLFTIIATGTSYTIVQDSLLAPGPYLSDSVLKAAILKTTIPMETLANVLIPNSPLDSIVISTLSSIGLPDTLVARLNEYQSDSILSSRAILINGINYYTSLMDITDNALITALETDTNVTAPFDSAQAVLKSDPKTLPRLAQLASLQWAAAENSTLLVTLDTLKKYDVDSTYANYRKLLPVLITLSADSNGYFALKGNSTDSTLLEQIAMDTTLPGYTNARAVLGFVYNQPFEETVLPLSSSGHKARKHTNSLFISTTASSQNSILNSRFNLFPNPATNELNVTYSLTQNAQSAHIELFDEIGNEVATWSLPTSQTEITENISNFPQGFYLYSILVNNIVVQRGKLIIER